jgi:6-phosphogluconate dehydrogenase
VLTQARCAQIDEFIKKKGEGKKLAGGHTIEEFCQLLSTPRRVHSSSSCSSLYRIAES